MNPVLEFKSVTIKYPQSTAPVVTDISFHIHKDERVALLGLNGSGKTTILLAAAGLLNFSGTILIDGVKLEKKTAKSLREKIGFLFNAPEDQILFPKVIDDVSFGLIRKGVKRERAYEKAREILNVFDILEYAEKSTFQLSHGQKQRVALAGALIAEPIVFLLDEPSSALDPPSKLNLSKLLTQIPSSFLITTHDIEFATLTCSRFLVISNGSLKEFTSCNDAKEYLLGDISMEKKGKSPH